MKKEKIDKKDQSTTETKKDEKKNELSFEMVKKIFVYSARLNRIIWTEHKKIFLLYIGVFIILAFLPSIRNGSLALIVNSFDKGFNTNIQFLILLLFIAVGGFSQIFQTIRGYIRYRFGKNVRLLFDTIILKKVGEMDIASREAPEQSNLIQKVSEFGIGRIIEFIQRQLFITSDIIELIIASVILIYANWWCFILFVLVTIPELIIEARFGYGLWKTSEETIEQYRKMWTVRWSVNNINTFIETKLFNMSDYLVNLFRKMRIAIYEREDVDYRKRTIWSLYSNVASILVFGFIVYTFFLDVVNKNISIGAFIFFISSAQQLRNALGGISFNLASQYQDTLFVGDIFKLLDSKPIIVSPKNPISVSFKTVPLIEFNNVMFSYPGSEKKVINDFSISIKPGEKIALIGENGSGKSTLVKLLARAYDPIEGNIKVNGTDIRNIDLKQWQSVLGVLSQKFADYESFSVGKAISFGRKNGEKLDYEKIKEAARHAEANAFIKKLEKKYDQIIGNEFTNGTEFSGGERQKLALSRIFYRDAQVIVLDEPTASLDAESEINIFERLEKIYKDRTIIFISHKFNTVRSADRICLIADGKIKEIGSHNELMKLNGEYARLFTMQAKGYSIETN